jgi:hypothetical protein
MGRGQSDVSATGVKPRCLRPAAEYREIWKRVYDERRYKGAPDGGARFAADGHVQRVQEEDLGRPFRGSGDFETYF